MTRYLSGRIVSLVLSLVAASVIIFLMLEMLPGDPAQFILGMNADPANLAALRAELGLDAPAVDPIFRLARPACCTAISASATPIACRWAS